MTLKKITAITLFISAFMLVSFKGDKDPLHKRKFTVQITEIKDGKPKTGKPLEDEIEFKDGRVFSTAMFDKHEIKWVKCVLTKDSTYTDEGEEKHLYEAEAITTNDNIETLTMNFHIDGFDIEGTFKLTKKDALKKMYTFTGKEKVKNKK